VATRCVIKRAAANRVTPGAGRLIAEANKLFLFAHPSRDADDFAAVAGQASITPLLGEAGLLLDEMYLTLTYGPTIQVKEPIQ
jgi:hypothetical protein